MPCLAGGHSSHALLIIALGRSLCWATYRKAAMVAVLTLCPGVNTQPTHASAPFPAPCLPCVGRSACAPEQALPLPHYHLHVQPAPHAAVSGGKRRGWERTITNFVAGRGHLVILSHGRAAGAVLVVLAFWCWNECWPEPQRRASFADCPPSLLARACPAFSVLRAHLVLIVLKPLAFSCLPHALPCRPDPFNPASGGLKVDGTPQEQAESARVRCCCCCCFWHRACVLLVCYTRVLQGPSGCFRVRRRACLSVCAMPSQAMCSAALLCVPSPSATCSHTLSA